MWWPAGYRNQRAFPAGLKKWRQKGGAVLRRGGAREPRAVRFGSNPLTVFVFVSQFSAENTQFYKHKTKHTFFYSKIENN